MELEYRAGTKEDLPNICEMVRRAIAQMEQNGIRQWDELYPTEEDFQNDIEKNQLFAAWAQGKIAAVCTLNQECDEEYQNGDWKYRDVLYYVIHRLCVSPDFQNQGVAKAFVEYMEKKAAMLGAGAIRLDAFSENPYALKLYGSCGYSKVGTVHWRKGMFYLMEKKIK